MEQNKSISHESMIIRLILSQIWNNKWRILRKFQLKCFKKKLTIIKKILKKNLKYSLKALKIYKIINFLLVIRVIKKSWNCPILSTLLRILNSFLQYKKFKKLLF